MALIDDEPTRRVSRIGIGLAVGLIVGLIALLVRVMIDVDAIGANAIPFLLVGAAVGAIVGALFDRSRPGR